MSWLAWVLFPVLTAGLLSFATWLKHEDDHHAWWLRNQGRLIIEEPKPRYPWWTIPVYVVLGLALAFFWGLPLGPQVMVGIAVAVSLTAALSAGRGTW